MAGRIERSWELVQESWAVLREDKALMVFPVLSSIACMMVMASFVMPFLFVRELRDLILNDRKQDDVMRQVVGLVVTFGFYFANYFVVVFFNVALVSCAIIRFRGGEPTLGDGLRAAGSRLPQILAWALLAASVGMILRALEERLELLGRIIISIIGVVWSMATYFVVPVLAVEHVGPFEAVKRSAKVLRKTWGESLVGNISMSAAGFLLAIPGILLILGGVAAGAALHSLLLGLLIGGAGFIYLVLLSVVMSTLQQIFLAGTYLYATEGTVPEGFSEDLMRKAFKRKKE